MFKPFTTMDQTSTKSIDVGGIFLMDLSVNESDTSNQIDYQQSLDRLKTTGDRSDHTAAKYYRPASFSAKATAAATTHQATNSIAEVYQPKQLNRQAQQQTTSGAIYRQLDYLGSSLDRLASVINCDEQQQPQQQQFETTSSSDYHGQEHSVTMAELQQLSPNSKLQHRSRQLFDDMLPAAHSSFSFSDESFAASSDGSLSASFNGYSEEDDEEDGCDKTSTTTREDSGVLDMKDLEGHLNSCNSFEEKNHQQQQQCSNSKIRNSGEMSISASTNIMAKNLISTNNKVSTKNVDDYHSNNGGSSRNPQHPHRFGKPTEGSGIGHKDDQRHSQQNHHHHHYSNGTRCVSASVPIQVPSRQMRKDLNKMKLNLLREEQAMEQELAIGLHEGGTAKQELIANNNENKNSLAVFDDDDAFLEQEYNANHHNHYPINEHGDEKLTAEEDPMKLFASIQALARSLHEDAEIFGSLPPKRTLESPIRSMALV